jgi:hypothetical protein
LNQNWLDESKREFGRNKYKNEGLKRFSFEKYFYLSCIPLHNSTPHFSLIFFTEITCFVPMLSLSLDL